ncbi:hypothetical protein BKA57DRAFT_510681 [Linnemannia elongata]|nr:hypothetical protein BKA57DRAFT_510681 [Linnemannia elongata]
MDDTIRCEGCKNGFPREGLETVLPILVSCLSETKTLLFCLDCRLIEYAFQAEPPPPGVNEYIDPVNGAKILPRISMFEAKAQYCMDSDDLINCRLIGANFVQAAGTPGIRAMYEERDVLLVARLKYGGDVGIVYARGWFAARGEQCRRKAYNTFQEPLPPGVDAYTDHIHGHTIVPRITETEARRQYCLTDCHFRDMPHVITAYSVRSAGHVYKVKLYEERDIVRLARRVWGGDVGIANARECYSWQDGGVTYTPMPPVGIERLRRDRIRQAFLDWGFYFATPTLPCVSNYVNYGQGQLSRIVAIYDTKIKIRIFPRITLTEATAQYCLLDRHLEELPYIQVHALEAFNGVYKVKMYEERLVLEKARWLYGGDIGIDNARDAFSWQKGGAIDLPPVGVVRERRNRIRQMFLQRELFAPSKLPPIQYYIENGRGDLWEIVNALAV